VVIAAPNQNSLTGLITKYTPHWFHVAVYRFVFGNKSAGKPGHGPFPTVMNKDMEPDALISLARANGARIVYIQLYEAARRRVLKEKHSRLLGTAFDACLWLLNTVFQEKHRFALSDFFLVLQPFNPGSPE